MLDSLRRGNLILSGVPAWVRLLCWGACVLAMSGLLLQIQYLIAHAPFVAASNSAASAFEVIMATDGFAPMFLVNVGLLLVTLSLSALMIPWQPLRQRC